MALETGTENEATFVRHAPCPSCGSKDNLGIYSDGHGWCFGCGFYQQSEETGAPSKPSVQRRSTNLLAGDYLPLMARKLTAETCKVWDYRTTHYNGKMAQAATYYTADGSQAIAQKVRMRNKEFVFIGEPKQAGLYGQHLFRDKGKMVVVTEGELDAMSVSQLQQHKWPVVSLP